MGVSRRQESAAAEISLQNPNGYREAGARRIRPWLEQLVAAIAPEGGSLAVRFVGDRAMKNLNRTYRGRNDTTDVLSFPGGATFEGGHIGDIAISVPVARRQAHAARHGVERELRVLLIHGVLHCLGYDHEADGGRMKRMEARLRRTWLERHA